ncbi:hypothetical protein M758_2G027100 [Ceratodon purpureus]|nr:hypothetical protein M758_2G027100 [Ceratodon purpureus]
MFFQDFFLVPMDFYDDSNYLLQLKVILFEKVNKQQFNFKVPHIQILQMNRNAGGDEDEECAGVLNVFSVLISPEVKIITGETFEWETLEGKNAQTTSSLSLLRVCVCVCVCLCAFQTCGSSTLLSIAPLHYCMPTS